MDVNLFIAGANFCATAWCAVDWLKDRQRSDAFFFWFNLLFFALNLSCAAVRS